MKALHEVPESRCKPLFSFFTSTASTLHQHPSYSPHQHTLHPNTLTKMPCAPTKNCRKRPRPMPPLPLQHTQHIPSPRIKMPRPPRIPPASSNTPDSIATPIFTQDERTPKPVPTPKTPHFTPLAQTPVPPPVTTPRTSKSASPSPLAKHCSVEGVLSGDRLSGRSGASSASEWSGGLYSGHKPLTIESIHPTPPSGASDGVCGDTLRSPTRHDARGDTRVRRLSFGGDLGTPHSACEDGEPTREQDKEQELCQTRLPARGDEKSTQKALRESAPFKGDRQSSLQHGNHDDTTRRQPNPRPEDERSSGALERRGAVAEAHVPESVSPYPDTPSDARLARGRECTSETPRTPLQNTPAAKPAISNLQTPEDTVVKRCRAPRWDGPITQIPETPLDKLPPREAPVYFVKSANTEPAKLPSLREPLPLTPIEFSPNRGNLRLQWVDFGHVTDSRDTIQDEIENGDGSDSASTEPPSPVRKRDAEEVEVSQCRAQVFCRSVRVSIPAGGFRSPSPETTPPHT